MRRTSRQMIRRFRVNRLNSWLLSHVYTTSTRQNLKHQPATASTSVQEVVTISSRNNSNCSDFMMMIKPIIISGPSGGGKSTILAKAMKEYPDAFAFSVSHTTRKPRDGELDGQHYYFVEKSEFERMIKDGEFLEHAQFGGNFYGTSKKAVQDICNSGKICVLDVELQGVRNFKKAQFEAKYIFVRPPSMEVLENRLRQRGTETDDSLEKRLKHAKEDLLAVENESTLFDVVVINEQLDKAYSDFLNAIRSELDVFIQKRSDKEMSNGEGKDMVRCAGDLKNCHVIEVGPGPGGITRAILEKPCLRLDVVELDRQFIPALEVALDFCQKLLNNLTHLKHHAQDRMFIHRGDIMQTDVGGIWEEAAATKCDWMDQNPPFSLIGNLPFHISTPLIIKLMRSISDRTGPFAFGRVPMMFSFQLEVAKRMVAPLGSDFRSRIGLTCQNWAEPKIMFDIPGKCFTPQPEVSVAFVRLTPRLEPQIPVAFEVSNKVFRVLFHLRRKYLRKVVRLLYPEPMLDDMADDLLRHCRLDPTMVVPMLDMQNFAEMCLFYEKQCRE
uniref:guanylate kinase n=1 Tax=Meloidogyne javanica TaxID=6303 RepID=A0A915N4I8_MELJA